MQRPKTSVLHGAVLATLLIGTQTSGTIAAIGHELCFDEHGRVVNAPVTAALEPAPEDEPGSVPNYKC